ncbi:MAG: RNA ligase RtcB family protein, partial [Proteobacteria bacterium]|nr:RNA ligase RtcB family protein [Pseudomonadota bacterium]
AVVSCAVVPGAVVSGMFLAVGLPDLHPGKGSPVGAAFASHKMLYPYLIGNDVGCGMGLWLTNLRRKKIKRDRWVDKISGLETLWNGDRAAWLTQGGVEPSGYDEGLGTIGGGNHFAELQVTETIEDSQSFKELGLLPDNLVLLVHSGSRGIGDGLLRRHTEVHGAKGVAETSEEAVQYLEGHDYALKWAESNRALVAHRFLSCLGADDKLILDIC